MRDTSLPKMSPTNGHSKPTLALVPTEVTEREQLLSAVDTNASLQELLSKVTTPAGVWLTTLSKAIGPAEAEIEFTEEITIRES